MKNIVTQVSVILFLLYSCNSKQSKQPEGLNRAIAKITVAIADGSFDAPELIPSGYVNIELLNNTNEMHSAHLIKLDAGYTSKQLIEAYSDSIKTGGERPRWMTHIGGIISGAGTSDIILFLEPGNYTWVCVMGPDTLPHFSGHEHQSVVVSGEIDRSVLLPDPDVIISMTDINHGLNTNIKPGLQSIEIINTGTKYHLMAISKLNSGATAEDVINWFKSFNGPPPAVGIVATSAIGPGLSARLNQEFEPGDYVLYCMANVEGKFHLLDGAISSIKVD